jgi:hypothetical protein
MIKTNLKKGNYLHIKIYVEIHSNDERLQKFPKIRNKTKSCFLLPPFNILFQVLARAQLGKN